MLKVVLRCRTLPFPAALPAAEEGKLTLRAGGSGDLFQAVEPIFQAVAKQYFLMGGPGSGTAMKLVVNTLLGIGMQAIAEAVALARNPDLIAAVCWKC